jgi:hypothetical protein
MTPVRELAAQLPPLPRGKENVSEAIRHIIAEWNAGRGRPGGDPAQRAGEVSDLLRAELEELHRRLDELEGRPAGDGSTEDPAAESVGQS